MCPCPLRAGKALQLPGDGGARAAPTRVSPKLLPPLPHPPPRCSPGHRRGFPTGARAVRGCRGLGLTCCPHHLQGGWHPGAGLHPVVLGSRSRVRAEGSAAAGAPAPAPGGHRRSSQLPHKSCAEHQATTWLFLHNKTLQRQESPSVPRQQLLKQLSLRDTLVRGSLICPWAANYTAANSATAH